MLPMFTKSKFQSTKNHTFFHQNASHLCLLLGSKTLGTKYIRTSICNLLVNHDQNIESGFKLAQSVFICKIGIE